MDLSCARTMWRTADEVWENIPENNDLSQYDTQDVLRYVSILELKIVA